MLVHSDSFGLITTHLDESRRFCYRSQSSIWRWFCKVYISHLFGPRTGTSRTECRFGRTTACCPHLPAPGWRGLCSWSAAACALHFNTFHSIDPLILVDCIMCHLSGHSQHPDTRHPQSPDSCHSPRRTCAASSPAWCRSSCRTESGW